MPKITSLQITAYSLRVIHQTSLPETADMMGCTSNAVSCLLKRLKKNKPDLFAKNGDIKVFRYSSQHQKHIVRKF